MSAKKNPVCSAVLFLALVLALAGCTPAGPRALLKGKKYLDRGDYADAVAELKTATELLATNAAAWNYFGVALQRAGQLDAAGMAYGRALDVDRDLIEARLNLGILYLEQNKVDAAKTEFTAYTLRRPNDPTGWLKLGSAQLKLGETVPAERSFSAVLALKTSEAEAYNGLGLARIQRNKPHEAAQFFTAAVQARPGFSAAILNLATVSQQFLHDNKAALENYRAYLALTPKPANWDAVNVIAENLEKSLAPVAVAVAPTPAPIAKPIPPTAAPVVETKPPQKIPPVAIVHAPPAPKPVIVTPPPQPVPAAPVKVVQVAPEPKIVAAPPAPAEEKPLPALPVPEPPAKPSLLNRLFAAPAPDNAATAPKFLPSGVTPLPGDPTPPPPPTPTPPVPEKKVAPVVIIPPAPVDFPRYAYLSPRRPQPGNRRAATSSFTQARMAEQEQQWPLAFTEYNQAVALDPSWFEAQYNAGVIAHRQRNYEAALASYETALAIQPSSVDTRYNFALALKAAGYVPDAANELKKILSANPNEVRAHLALANICAQQLHDPGQARTHYLAVLELDPQNPQSNDIRFWLAANPG
jgi:tetratricopeptide (TPR) repeat protein